MRTLILHIGLPHCGAEMVQRALIKNRAHLLEQGILFPTAPGRKNHTRLFMAASDPDRVEPLRQHRGHADPQDQEKLRRAVLKDLAAEIDASRPHTIILSAPQLATLPRQSELERVREMLAPLADRFVIAAHLDDPARLLTNAFAAQIADGRFADLQPELDLVARGLWSAPHAGEAVDRLTGFPEVQSPPFWLDQQALIARWAAVFPDAAFSFRPHRPDLLAPETIAQEMSDLFGVPLSLSRTKLPAPPANPSAETLARMRAINAYLHRLSASGLHIPPPLRARMFDHVAIDGPSIAPAALAAISAHFRPSLEELGQTHPALAELEFVPDAPETWSEPPFSNGFRATQYMAAFLPWIEEATKEAKDNPAQQKTPGPQLPARAHAQFRKLIGSRFAPHNALGPPDVTRDAPPFPPADHPAPAKGSTGNVIIACMKNEGPYILEWIAYHRAIGFDGFLIYTNDCTDGTDKILERLQALGVVEHRDNSAWRGNSPQQFALNQSRKEPLVRNADWIAHIDIDEFINIRTGNGTLPDLMAQLPEATHIAMTWRLFGHNGVRTFSDTPVIAQFTHAAPKYCPKPHTAWGFKTLGRNMGAYDKISCHRPNKLKPGKREKLLWVNGSGRALPDRLRDKGWRSDIKTVGYDLVQLNHYAVRSAESFLIKRQRGRALHVDRSLGTEYWVRMDWSDHEDRSIQRNLPRMVAERDALLADPELAALHAASVDWHRAKAAELRQMPEFADLYAEITALDLTPMERTALALANDSKD